MDVTIARNGSKTVVTLVGRLDSSNAVKFQEDITTLLEDPAPDFEIDCTDMEYTSSQGLRIFLTLQKNVSSKGGSMVMMNMKPQVKEVFDITGFSNIIKIL